MLNLIPCIYFYRCEMFLFVSKLDIHIISLCVDDRRFEGYWEMIICFFIIEDTYM